MLKPVKIYESFEAMFIDLVELDPSNIAFEYLHDDELKQVTIKEFYDKICIRVIQYRKEQSSSKAIIGPLSVDFLVDFFASVIAGKTTMLIDAMLPIKLILGMIKMSQVETVSIDESYFEKSEVAIIDSSWSKPTKCENAGEGDILFFTSGTTSMSKAVVLTSKSLLRAAYNGQSCLPIHKGDVLLSCLPMSHVFGFVCAMLWPLCNQATTAISRGLRYIPQDLTIFKASVLSQVPTAVDMLLKYNAFNKELHTILIGAGPISYASIKAIREKGIYVSFGYGLTETSSGVAISVEKEDPYAMDLCPDTICLIADDKEVLLKTPCMMKGYYHDEAATKAAIREGYLHTNDLGYLDKNNCLHITGRKNDVIVLANGTKINLEEWEIALAKLLIGIDFAIISRSGNLVLLYHPGDVDITDEDVKAKLDEFNKTCPLGQSISKSLRIDEAIPRTLTGKIQRYILGAKYGQEIH